MQLLPKMSEIQNKFLPVVEQCFNNGRLFGFEAKDTCEFKVLCNKEIKYYRLKESNSFKNLE